MVSTQTKCTLKSSFKAFVGHPQYFFRYQIFSISVPVVYSVVLVDAYQNS